MAAKILLTNDDGIQAAGLRALAESVRELGELTIVAPSGERSAAAQSLTLRRPIYYEQIAPREFAVEGTPADAMILAFHALLPEAPALAVSGINHGGNLGENVYYSGTVGAAMEAAIHHVPAIAISAAYRDPEVDFAPAADLARRLAAIVLEEGLPDGVLLNVNVPQGWTGEVRFTRQSAKITRSQLRPGADGSGRRSFQIFEEKLLEGIEPGTDHAAIRDGAASITPLTLDHTHAQSLNHLSHWAKILTGKKRRT